ncbi:hypothetical protein EVAR_79787_1 [Eumeta japonica]|uniref:Uncharacterized protein n=1 Tax=Eumeta variegata TaxID=151549 RepID=A0A4C1WRI4_EUMVA|nr:hypothetical protein EVAR_79787_1 [Eumeta japonica]
MGAGGPVSPRGPGQQPKKPLSRSAPIKSCSRLMTTLCRVSRFKGYSPTALQTHGHTDVGASVIRLAPSWYGSLKQLKMAYKTVRLLQRAVPPARGPASTGQERSFVFKVERSSRRSGRRLRRPRSVRRRRELPLHTLVVSRGETFAFASSRLRRSGRTARLRRPTRPPRRRRYFYFGPSESAHVVSLSAHRSSSAGRPKFMSYRRVCNEPSFDNEVQ